MAVQQRNGRSVNRGLRTLSRKRLFGALALVVVISAGFIQLMGSTGTQAAYGDSARADFASSLGKAIGSKTFEVQTYNGISKVWTRGLTPETAMYVPVNVLNIGIEDFADPVLATIRFRVLEGSGQGYVLPWLGPKSSCVKQCLEAFAYVRVTANYDGAAPFATDLSVDEFNSLAARQTSLLAGSSEHDLNLSFFLDLETPYRYNKVLLDFDLRLDAEAAAL